MPVHVNAISTHLDLTDLGATYALFDDLSGKVEIIGEQIETFKRAGVDGTGFRRLGERGNEFELSSVVYCEDWEEARDLVEGYKAFIGATDALYLIKQTLNRGKFVVLGVEEDEPQAMQNVAGNAVGYLLHATLSVRLTARWRLVQVELPTEEYDP